VAVSKPKIKHQRTACALSGRSEHSNDKGKSDSGIIFSIIFTETAITVGEQKKPTAFHKEPHCPWRCDISHALKMGSREGSDRLYGEHRVKASVKQ